MYKFKRLFSSGIFTVLLTALLLSPSGAKAASSSILGVGSKGDAVVKLQGDLKVLGYYTYNNITGYYGSITKDAVARFQRANSLTVDGIVGPNTLSRIDQVLSDSPSTLYYTVQSGDSLFKISIKYGTTIERLKNDNNLSSNTIYTGQVLMVVKSVQTVGTSQSIISGDYNENIYWLSRIIEAEAAGESYNGKVAVGNVVVNRVLSPLFPSTVKGVIFETYQGIPQFSPVADKTIYNAPSQDSINAAKEALKGVRVVGNATYFFNPAKSSANWIVANKIYVTEIGNHVFYR